VVPSLEIATEPPISASGPLRVADGVEVDVQAGDAAALVVCDNGAWLTTVSPTTRARNPRRLIDRRTPKLRIWRRPDRTRVLRAAATRPLRPSLGTHRLRADLRPNVVTPSSNVDIASEPSTIPWEDHDVTGVATQPPTLRTSEPQPYYVPGKNRPLGPVCGRVGPSASGVTVGFMDTDGTPPAPAFGTLSSSTPALAPWRGGRWCLWFDQHNRPAVSLSFRSRSLR
jgi:hypothetical protein